MIVYCGSVVAPGSGPVIGPCPPVGVEGLVIGPTVFLVVELDGFVIAPGPCDPPLPPPGVVVWPYLVVVVVALFVVPFPPFPPLPPPACVVVLTVLCPFFVVVVVFNVVWPFLVVVVVDLISKKYSHQLVNNTIHELILY